MKLMDGEIAKHIRGFSGDYSVTNYGRVYSHVRGIWRKYYINCNGYTVLTLKKKTYRVHVLVAKAFIKKPKSHLKLELNHKDLNKQNNRDDNIEYVTSSQNKQHCLKAGAGNRCTVPDFLTQEQVTEMKKMYFVEKYSQVHIAKLFNCSRSHVCNIMNGRGWTQIPTPLDI